MTLPNWAREPLVHFLALGGIIYVLLTWGGEPVDPASRVITVDANQQAQLSLSFERLMGRAPTDAELDARIDQYVRNEVLYREALRLGLDQGDAVVRQRMVSKMDQSASAVAEIAQPDDATLRAFYDENAARYSGGPLISFEQLYFSSQEAARNALSNGEESGEAISLPAALETVSLGDVQAQFGEAFSQALFSLEEGEQWQGPVASGFGWHLVKLTNREAAQEDFEQARARVENDWRSDQIDERKARAYEVLRSAYRVEIDR